MWYNVKQLDRKPISIKLQPRGYGKKKRKK